MRRITNILETAKSDIESVIEDLESDVSQEAYDDGYNTEEK